MYAGLEYPPGTFVPPPLTPDHQSIISTDRWDDPTIQLLYRLAKDICKADYKEQNSKSSALITICKASGSQFAKIAKTISIEPKKASDTLKLVTFTAQI